MYLLDISFVLHEVQNLAIILLFIAIHLKIISIKLNARLTQMKKEVLIYHFQRILIKNENI